MAPVQLQRPVAARCKQHAAPFASTPVGGSAARPPFPRPPRCAGAACAARGGAAGPSAAAPAARPALHAHTRLCRDFQANDGLLYLRNFFEPQQFATVLAECAQLRHSLRPERSSTAEHRLGCYVPPGAATVSLFAAQSVAQRLSQLASTPLFLSEYPLEYRTYPPGAHMAWHRDEQLFQEPQVELVLTVSNSSDSVTEWQDAQGRLHSQWTEPNSLLLVRAGGAMHRVLPIKRGKRSIVKVVFTSTHTRVPAYEDNLLNTYAH